jgi:uncharacterized protein with NRDE domain
MCLIAFAWGASERFPFVIAANRDEFYERPTAPLAEWTSPSGSTVISGRDLQGGGTWMGFSPNGRFAMLTNVRNPSAKPPPNVISRGSLPLAWLESDLPAQQWAKQLQPQRYQGFNLIVGDWHQRVCHYMSNQFLTQNFKPFSPLAGINKAQTAHHLIANELPWGAVYGLSNATLDTPWPKTLQLKNQLLSLLDTGNAEQLSAHCLEALKQSNQPARDQLPDTGLALEWELALSSVFVSYPAVNAGSSGAITYGTRSSLVGIMQADAGLSLTEITHHPQETTSSEARSLVHWH